MSTASLPADRRAAVEAWLATPSGGRRACRRLARAGRAIRARYGAVAREPVPARFDLDRLARARPLVALASRRRRRCVAFLAGGVAGWLAHGASAAAPCRARHPHRRGARARTSSTSREVRHPIEVRAERAASAAVAVAARRHDPARARSRAVRPQADGRAAAARARRPGGAVHVRERRRASATRSTARKLAGAGTALRYNAAGERRGGALGRERHRLRGERAGRPRPAPEDRAGRLRADGEPRRPTAQHPPRSS